MQSHSFHHWSLKIFLMTLCLVAVVNAGDQIGGNADSAKEPSVAGSAIEHLPLPEGITSFGGAIMDGKLYLYGGHRGRPHHYSIQGQSNQLLCLDLTSPKKWETLAKGPRLQGLAMVAHNGSLYRMGGFTAKNQEEEAQSLWSVSDFARYTPEVSQWEALPPMPVPRSSFDAVVVGNRIYVAGGWSMQGEREKHWHNSAYYIDLEQNPLVWKALPDAPFQRRALSLGELQGKVFAVGGMQEAGGPTTQVSMYDPEKNTWSDAPPLIGGSMDGFGSSAFSVGDVLYVSTYSGKLQKLEPGSEQWELERELRDARFFHRMLPLGNGQLVLVGGANMKIGKFLETEVVRVNEQ